MSMGAMEKARDWMVDPDTLHVAEDASGGWKVLREGAPTAESYHDSKYDAIDAARTLARRKSARKIKIHEPDGSLNKVLDLGD